MKPFDPSPTPRLGFALSRRRFLGVAGAAGGSLILDHPVWAAESVGRASKTPSALSVAQLPTGNSPPALTFPQFPDRLHAFVWRNWTLVPADRMAQVVGASAADIRRVGQAMGLFEQPPITADQQNRSYITVIRRNWHLLPYEQLLSLLDWTPERMAYTLREDDFLLAKLGNLKPQCEPIRYAPASETVRAREQAIADVLRQEFPSGLTTASDPLFAFVSRLSTPPTQARPAPERSRFSPRFCYSYFALYGDPLLEEAADPYPEGYLARLADAGVDGVWLQAVLHKLAPFPWDPSISMRYEQRLARLGELVKRASRQGIGVYLYLNEPRAMPLSFFQERPELKGVVEGDHAALCTSHPEVRKWMTAAVAFICHAVPELAGFFTITASENLTNCWSHNGGKNCPRCGQRPPSDVIAEVIGLFRRGIQESGARTQLIAWDWGWADSWAEAIINQLPLEAALMSVSEWSTPIERGGIKTQVGEYSISTIGPGPRARNHWAIAQKRGLKTLAKIQAGNTWELSAVPYIPALENVARHAANLLKANVDGLMLGWTLGGYPSPNLEMVMEVARTAPVNGGSPGDISEIVARAMQRVAARRFGDVLGPAVVRAWRAYSVAFSEFPFDGGLVYNAPMQYGPSNLLFAQPTGYHATMIGFPYDDLDGWRGPYPALVFIGQFEKMAEAFEQATNTLRRTFEAGRENVRPEHRQNLVQELTVAEAAAIHFQSTANQARFVEARQALATAPAVPIADGLRPERDRDPVGRANAPKQPDADVLWTELDRVLRAELALAVRLYEIQSRDSRIGFEASNQYYYVPLDLAEKVLNCRNLLERWLSLGPQPGPR
jgi:hypothetical protein